MGDLMACGDGGVEMERRMLQPIIIMIFRKENKFIMNIEKNKINQVNLKGLKHGLWRCYRSDGSLDEENYYVDGKRNGLHRTYTVSGKLIDQINYSNDLIHGLWLMNWTDGNLLANLYFEYGVEEGEQIAYDY